MATVSAVSPTISVVSPLSKSDARSAAALPTVLLISVLVIFGHGLWEEEVEAGLEAASGHEAASHADSIARLVLVRADWEEGEAKTSALASRRLATSASCPFSLAKMSAVVPLLPV